MGEPLSQILRDGAASPCLVPGMFRCPPEDLIAQMREIFDTRPSEFEGDPVRTHLADCIAELERIRSEDGA